MVFSSIGKSFIWRISPILTKISRKIYHASILARSRTSSPNGRIAVGSLAKNKNEKESSLPDGHLPS
jgi:hypothetical protein